MENRVVYELKMFSSALFEEPAIVCKNMDMMVGLKGFDDEDNCHECTIKFTSVVGFEFSLAGFSRTAGAYDKVVEVIDSEWKETFKVNNAEKFSYWNPRHYAIYLDGYGLYQFLAKDVVVEEK